jgi:hypothetical protein
MGNEYFPRPLKDAGSKKIEDAITRAASELTGEEYEADILSLDFSPEAYSYMSDSCEIRVKIRRKQDSLLDSINQRQTDHQVV